MRLLQAGWFELQNTRDWYRQACGPAGMKRSHVMRFIEVHLLYCAVPFEFPNMHSVFSGLKETPSLSVTLQLMQPLQSACCRPWPVAAFAYMSLRCSDPRDCDGAPLPQL